MSLLAILQVLVIIVIVWFVFRVSTELFSAPAATLRELATRTGTAYEAPEFSRWWSSERRITGEYCGRSLLIRVNKSSSQASFFPTLVVLSLKNPIGGILDIHDLKMRIPKAARGKWRHRWQRMLGQDVQIGEVQFDRRFTIKRSNPEDFATRVFSSQDLAQRFLDVVPAGPGLIRISVSDRSLEYCGPLPATAWPFATVEQNARRFQALIDVLCRMAEAVDGVSYL